MKSLIGLGAIAAEVQVHPSGRFLYASNRMIESIAVAVSLKNDPMKLVFSWGTHHSWEI
jgi:6-phosphogluconolactonase (cycloisomerase 2 family)